MPSVSSQRLPPPPSFLSKHSPEHPRSPSAQNPSGSKRSARSRPSSQAEPSHVPDLDERHRFRPRITTLRSRGFAFNRLRDLIQGLSRHRHIDPCRASCRRSIWPCIRVNPTATISRIDLGRQGAGSVCANNNQVHRIPRGSHWPWAHYSIRFAGCAFDEYDAGRPERHVS